LFVPQKLLSGVFLLLAAAPARAAVPALDHVAVVIMENHDWSQVRSYPYVTQLRAAGCELTNSFAVGHPSQPNYLELWAASALGITDDTCPPPGSPFSAANLGRSCEAAGKTWRAYSENLPSVGSSTCSASGGLYVRKHEPWTDFSNLNHQNERPFTDLATDIANHTLPNLVFIVPNNCNNTHDCSIQTGDDWLAAHLPSLINAVGPNGVVILTWDEDSGTSGNKNHILTIFVGGRAKAGYQSTATVNHYNVVRTICDALGLTPFANASSATPIGDVWRSVSTGVGLPGVAEISLSPPSPNPSQGPIAMTLRLTEPARVRLSITDAAGRAVRRIDLGLRSGDASIEWDGRQGDGTMADTGLYFIQVSAGDRTFMRKASLIR